MTKSWDSAHMINGFWVIIVMNCLKEFEFDS